MQRRKKVLHEVMVFRIYLTSNEVLIYRRAVHLIDPMANFILQMGRLALCLMLCSFAFATTEVSSRLDAESLAYLKKYGYAHPSDAKTATTMSLDEEEEAVTSFQRFVGLPQTGQLDEPTRDKMEQPRCGNRDILVVEGYESKRKKRFTAQGSKWRKKALTYKFINYTPDLTRNQTERAVAEAFGWWAKHSALSFTQVPKTSRADIVIRFASTSHGDGEPFDGPGYQLAHAFLPAFGGNVHFDEDEHWSIWKGIGKYQLLLVAAHEFGHSLGISHSTVREALMAPYYNPNVKDLHQDDIDAIQSLYGTRSPSTTKKPEDIRKTTIKPTTVASCTGRLDAITQLQNGSTYAFAGDQFWRLNKEDMNEGYPQKTREVWGVSGRVDAALTFQDYTDIFQGDVVYRFEKAKLKQGYPLPISEVYRGIPSNVDAAFVWSGNGMIYFMQGNIYWRYDSSKKKASRSRIIDVWEGLPARIHAALQWNGKTYFFVDGVYYRFDDIEFEVYQTKKNPYPRRTDEWWLGCKSGTYLSSSALRHIPGDKGDDGNGGKVANSSKLLFGLTALVVANFCAA